MVEYNMMKPKKPVCDFPLPRRQTRLLGKEVSRWAFEEEAQQDEEPPSGKPKPDPKVARAKTPRLPLLPTQDGPPHRPVSPVDHATPGHHALVPIQDPDSRAPQELPAVEEPTASETWSRRAGNAMSISQL